MFIVFSVPLIVEADTLISQEDLRNELLLITAYDSYLPVGEKLNFENELFPFYEQQGFNPVWIEGNSLTGQAEDLIEVIASVSTEGFNPDDFHLNIIQTLINEESMDDNLTSLEIILSDAFFTTASYFLSGKVNPETIEVDWVSRKKDINLSKFLQESLASDTVDENLRSLLPNSVEYQQMKEALAFYRGIKKDGGWAVIPEGPTLKRGMSSNRVAMLRKRLEAVDSIETTSDEATSGDYFDESLDRAVRGYQDRHGLEADGVVGPNTLRTLNVTIEQRIKQLELNMERWRWLPQSLGAEYVLVNIANFRLRVIKDMKTVLEMKAIVGRNDRRTPVFSDRISYIVINPYWYMPKSIAVQDKLPLIKKDDNYFTENNFKVFEMVNKQLKEIPYQAIDWSKITAKNFKYILRQEPGPNNALGSAKFMFPNKFNVYLHDTPGRELFAKTNRDFSSGCIRLEQPIDLAVYLLGNKPEWTREKINSFIGGENEKTVYLSTPIPVYLLYWTAWVEEGNIIFRPDIYSRDKTLEGVFY